MSSNYHLTCREITIEGNVISAECQKRDGTWQKTSITLRGIENNDGILEVTDPEQASSFHLSSMNIAIDEDRLSATCQRRDGLWNESSIVLNGIENIDGNLQYIPKPLAV